VEPTREALFEILVREHEAALRAFVLSAVQDRTAADDIVQECFIAAWQSFSTYDENRPFAAWLRGIAHHLILEYYRNTSTAQRHERIVSPELLCELSREYERLVPARGDVFPETLAALRSCLTHLARQDQTILDRVYQHDCSCRRIAYELGQSIEWVKKRLQRARAALHECVLGKLRRESVHG
jgi:RNA polymerase sigma-70 factor